MPPAEAPSPTIEKVFVCHGFPRRVPAADGRRPRRSIRTGRARRPRTGRRFMPIAQKTRIFLADDHETVREGLKLLLNAQSDMEVVGEAERWRCRGHRSVGHLKPDIIVLDVSMPGMNGLKAAEALRQSCARREGADPHPPFRRWLPASAAARGRGGLRAQAKPSGRAAPRHPLGGGRRQISRSLGRRKGDVRLPAPPPGGRSRRWQRP